jgi:hypothetical protein
VPAPEAARVHQAQRQVLVAAAAATASQRWAQVDAQAIAESWLRGSAQLAAAVSAAQLAAAQQADPYVAAALAAQEATAPVGAYAVAAGALAGVASDGRDLLSLLYQPAVAALTAIREGAPVARALQVGAAGLDAIVRTQVADAGRVADQVALVAKRVDGYVRLVVGATCSRCIILAGRWYPWSAGFERHPNCDCVHIPAAKADAAGFVQSPEAIYATLTPAERSAAGWSRAEQQAIADGANISAVTNVHRGGVYTAGGRKFTREGGSRRRPRITPEQIYVEAAGDRGEAIRLLRLHGFIRGGA